MTENGKIRKVKSVTDINWKYPLYEQLEPNLKGAPRSATSPQELRALRAQIPNLTKHLFDGLLPADNNTVITAVQIHMSEVAAWVLNATHWFSILDQPMMVIVWCHNWEDASKFQYLMQILQVHFGDYVPRYQIFMFDDSKIYGSIQQWQEPTTIWDGKPVLGFMAETFLDDLSTIGFKDFNPMWTFPTTSVNQCWEPITLGMAPWHIREDVDKQKSKEALQSPSPLAAFKACNMIHALGIAYSKIVLPSSDSKGESKGRTYCPTTWSQCYQWEYASQYADQLRHVGASSLAPCWSQLSSMQGMYTSSAYSIEQEECESSQLCICRLQEDHYVRCHDQPHSMHCFNDSKGMRSPGIDAISGCE